MKDMGVSVLLGFMMSLVGAYILYQSVFSSRISTRNVEWLQGTPGVLIGCFVILVGTGVAAVGAARYALQQNRHRRF